MDEKKPWWQSKTIWSGVAQILISVLILWGVDATELQAASIGGVLAGLATVISRVVAKSRLALSSE